MIKCRWLSLLMCALLLFSFAAIAEEIEETDEPVGYRRIRSEEYYDAMERIGLFSSMTDEMVEAGANAVVDPARPMVALTFDDGPSEYTPRIVELLRQYGGKATFFMVGNRVNRNKETVKLVADAGNQIGTHTWDHPKLTGLSAEGIETQLRDSANKLSSASGQIIKLMRPPYGSVNSNVKDVCERMGLPIIRWSIDTEDWRTRNADDTYSRIMEEVRDGSVILCHDIVPSTADAMAYVIPELIRRGYQLVTIDELFEYKGVSLDAGRVYDGLP